MESMGLAAPRRKTKYDIDPRNNAWANDDNKFGQKLMEKFGWAKGMKWRFADLHACIYHHNYLWCVFLKRDNDDMVI